MKKLIIILVVIAAIAFFAYSWFTSRYNEMASLNEGTTTAWAQVENVYQRRADLIPNLVNTVRGAANFEQQTLTDVINARAKATSIQVDPTNLSPGQIQAFDSAQSGLSSALGKLLVVSERYPELRATEAFRDLQVQLEGTENRITVERQRYNEVVQGYNTYIRLIPNNIIASVTNFDAKGYFSAQPGSDIAPVVDFTTPTSQPTANQPTSNQPAADQMSSQPVQ